MAAGLPAVDLYRENNLFDIPSGGVLLAHQTPESLAEAILYLISNPETLLKMSDFGAEFMKARSATGEIQEFLGAIEGILTEKPNIFDASAIVQQRFTGQAVIAVVNMSPSVVQHVRSQRNKLIALENQSIDTDLNDETFKSHSFVTVINQTSGYPVLINTSLASRIKRLIKRMVSIVR